MYNLNKQTAGTSSAVMAEKECFIELLDQAKKDLSNNLKSITTDGSISIRAHMKKETNIEHGLDVWHLAKNLAKNIKAKCRGKVILSSQFHIK